MGRTLRLCGALALASGILAAPHFSAAQAAPGWPTFHGGPNRDGAANVSGPTSEYALNQFQLGGAVAAGPVVSGAGRVFIGDSTGTLYAFDPKTSTTAPAWTYNTGNPIADAPGLTPDGQTAIVGSENGLVSAVNATNGSKRWSVSLDGPVHASPVVSNDGSTVFVASVNGTVEAISVSSGSKVWSTHLNGSIIGSPTLGQDGSVLYVSSTSGLLYALPSSGSSGGQASAPCYLDGPANSSPAVDSNGNVYAVSNIGTVFSFNPGCSGERWHVSVSTRTPSTSTPAIANGLVVVGNTNGYVYGISASAGTQQWQYKTGSAVYSSAAIATGNNQIYIGSGDGKLYGLSASGSATFSSARRLGIGVGSPALASDGTVWVATDDGALYHIGNLQGPPIVPATATPGPSATPTATPNVTSTPTATSTPTTVALTMSMKPQVAGGKRQTITVHSAPNTAVTLLVRYPNGDHHTGHVTTDASGNAVHNFTQPASKILHNKFYANVTATVGSGGAATTKTGQYKIGFAPVDVSAEPRSQKVGAKVQIYVHANTHTRVRARLSFPNHSSVTFNQTAGPKGWAHWTYTIGRGLTRGKNKTVTVTGSTVNAHPNHSTQTTFTIS